ncbi:aspartate aminotransferase family protein [Nocardioides sp. GXQ0305]|uniref:aspartate aminotransferase family protein n=1 Tax=Nocardioides sp. GXQ0305 TaxID=3423912 RepID=UPI003D7D5ACF
MTATQTAATLSSRLDGVIEAETARFLERQTRSRELAAEAVALAGGATSSWQVAEPHAVWISHGSGSRLHDVDGNEYSDFHGGYGVSLAGHAHPAIVAAVRERVTRGTHFAQPTADAIVVADNLTERFGLPRWRYGNSGTEVTMDAVHLMRAATGRDRILKVEGGYHGHHDSVMVSVLPEPDDEIGPAEAPYGVASNSGIPDGITGLVTVVPFNDLAAVEAALERHPGEVAGMIVEPIMMNAGIILPDDGYLAGLADLLHRHGALLAFDEVKTGLTTGPGGVTRRSGVTPDLVCLAKALGGGISTAAIGGTAEVMGLIETGAYEQVGTFNGNPLAMAAARAMLTEVLDDDAYRHLDHLRDRLHSGLQGVIDRHGAPWRVVTAGAKGCVSFLPHPIRNFRDFRELDDRYGHAHWLVQHNRGAFLPPWGKVEQWLVSVQHTDDDVDRFVANCDHLADLLLGDGP